MTRRWLVAAALVGCASGTGPAPGTNTKPAAPPSTAAAAGTVATRTFHSKALGVDKDYVVYLPAGYDARPDARWPVFYYLHGLTGSETNWVKHGYLDKTADRLGLAAIVVMPDGDDDFYIDSAMPIDYAACMKDGSGLFPLSGHSSRAKECVRHRAYETYIVDDLVHEIDGHFRTIATREGRAIAGLSMGGYGALVLAMRHLDMFAAAASHSGVDALLYAGPHPYDASAVQLWDDPTKLDSKLGPFGRWLRGLYGDELANYRAHDPATLIDALAPGQLAIYLDCGSEDDFQLDATAAYLHDRLRARKLDHTYYVGPGKHDFTFWAPRVEHSLAFLRDHTAAPR